MVSLQQTQRRWIEYQCKLQMSQRHKSWPCALVIFKILLLVGVPVGDTGVGNNSSVSLRVKQSPHGRTSPQEVWLHDCQQTVLMISFQQVLTMVTEPGLPKVNGPVVCGGTKATAPTTSMRRTSCWQWAAITAIALKRKENWPCDILGSSYNRFIS